ncbi:hypothetical protein Tco_0146938, partial [Tanacetum coccineum]
SVRLEFISYTYWEEEYLLHKRYEYIYDVWIKREPGLSKQILDIKNAASGTLHTEISACYEQLCTLLNFHVSYPRLYHLDLNPYCSVSDRNTFVPRVSSSEVFESNLVRGPSFERRSRPTGPTINWSWSRPIRSVHESSELAELMSLLTHFNLSDEQDSWEFYHRSIKKNFSKGHSQPHPSSATPSDTLEKNASFKGKHPSLKSNEQKDSNQNRRIPTRINLDMRGIDLDTLRCPVCDDDLE